MTNYASWALFMLHNTTDMSLICGNRSFVLRPFLLGSLNLEFVFVFLFGTGINREKFLADTIYWQDQVRHYWRLMNVDEMEIRNVMDMNAILGGFSVALSTWPVWVMNVVPATTNNTLSAIYDRGLIGAFHDW